MIAFAAIAPHGDVDERPELLAAMEELGRRCSCDTAVVVTPHNVHVEGYFAVVTAARVGEHATDRDLADAIVESARVDNVHVLRVSYGGNDATQAEMPLDWGTEIPLGFLDVQRVVVVSPARDRPLEEHIRAGHALSTIRERIALVASADHGHAHDPDGPYGFDPAAEQYDALVRAILGSERLDFRPLAALVKAAKADSLWQLLMLQGAVGEDARAELLAYAAPSYYGMLVATLA
jgi:aromatic ring-opening dioxygenase LigB subunit